MAGKQLGKLRQWAGEVISTREKTVATDEFRELEHDIELRRQGLWRLHVASDGYHEHLSKKKHCEALGDAEKLLPVDTLGTVMIQHGEEFGADSAYGMSLVNLGRAHCKMATLQETYAMMFEDTYIASLQRAEDEIKEYLALRKKLESRRLSLDAAISKLEKIRNSKKEKEKERVEAEDECERAQSRYDETAEDIRVRMHVIQENEALQLRDLRELLDIEVTYVEQFMEVLKDVKTNWVDESSIVKIDPHRSSSLHSFSRSGGNEVRSGSVRSVKSLSKHQHSSDESLKDDERKLSVSRSQGSKKAESKAPSRPPSRPPSRTSRKRSDSVATAVSEKEKDKDKEKSEKEKEKSRRMSVAGWASSAMNSVSGLGKKDKEKDKAKDKDNFATLRDGTNDDSDDSYTSARTSSVRSRSKSAPGTPSVSPKTSFRVLNSDTRRGASPKAAVALYDYVAGKPDELSFHAGDKISVVSEVLDGWWLGELRGRRGLFPTTYVEITSAASAPHLPQRPPAMSRFGGSERGNGNGHGHGYGRRDDYSASEDDEHPFGDHHYAESLPNSPLDGAFPDGVSSDGEYNEEERLVPARRSDDSERDRWHIASSAPPLLSARATEAEAAPVRKVPPPPPPRRGTVSSQQPPVPARPTIRAKSSHSSGSLQALATTPTIADDGITHSPFDSPGDFQ